MLLIPRKKTIALNKKIISSTGKTKIFDFSFSLEFHPVPFDFFQYFHRIDLVLDIIASMSTKTQSEQIKDCADLWLGIEDVFAHAMSIAQVCQPYNFKAISGSCQSILTEYENLKTQIHANPPDPTMNNLFTNTLTDALYRLERKINISVLTLVMEVFSDPFGALKKLIKICGIALNASDRTKNDLNSAIEEFDQLTDKSVQIGKFAIACSRDKNRENEPLFIHGFKARAFIVFSMYFKFYRRK